MKWHIAVSSDSPAEQQGLIENKVSTRPRSEHALAFMVNAASNSYRRAEEAEAIHDSASVDCLFSIAPVKEAVEEEEEEEEEEEIQFRSSASSSQLPPCHAVQLQDAIVVELLQA
jgi:hypothetical protein